MKSGSTYVSHVLARYFGVERIEPVEYWGRLEQNLVEQYLEPYLDRGFVVQMHLRPHVPNVERLRRHGVAVVYLWRNLGDVLVSFDDHIRMEDHRNPVCYIHDRARYLALPQQERYRYLIQYAVPWYVSFHLSWREAGTNLPVVRCRYEDLAADAYSFFARIIAELRDPVDASRLRAVLAAPIPNTRFNRGVSGRSREQLSRETQEFLDQVLLSHVEDLGELWTELPWRGAGGPQRPPRGDAEAVLQALATQQRAIERLEARLALQEQQAETSQRQIQDILNSRTWRALCAVGGLVLKCAPRLGPAGAVSRNGSSPEPAPPQSSPEQLLIGMEEPAPDEVVPQARTLAVQGWAMAPSGIERIALHLDDGPALEARLERPLAAANGPAPQPVARTGFDLELAAECLAAGAHSLRIRAFSRAGAVSERAQAFAVASAADGDYGRWIAEFEQRDAAAIERRVRDFSLQPLISIVMPVYRTPPRYLRRAIASVRVQSYDRWELCIADDGSDSAEIGAILRRSRQEDPRIRLARPEPHRGISAASNRALALARGEYIALLDHDDELSRDALFHLVDAINRQPAADVLYSDEDIIDTGGRRSQPFFKPDWSPDLLLSENYICHLLAASRGLVKRVGGFRSEFDGSQDYDLVLRLTERARKIVHIPRVLYHWRAAAGSTAENAANKPYCDTAARRALEDRFKRTKVSARVEPGLATGRWRVRYPIGPEERVTILIASGGQLEVLETCLASVADKTSYPHYDITVIDNSLDDRVETFVRRWTQRGRTAAYMAWRTRPFNYAALHNEAARRSGSSLLLFLNDDTEVIAPDWLQAMVELGVRPEVGAVGAKLLYPDGSIQHAGVAMGLSGHCGHIFRHFRREHRVVGDLPDVIRNISAVTGACLLVRAGVFQECGGFDERFALDFNDIDLCLRIGQRGYRILYTPHALLYHLESYTRKKLEVPPDWAAVERMRACWPEAIAGDPYYSPNLTRTAEDYSPRS